MSITKTIGGDRLGSGRKMKTSLHNYERSTHNLSYVWRSTMTPGTLVPFMKKVCLRGDTWSINLREMLRTMPSVGPLFGTYKLQLDIFACPFRLYNGVLHNNYVNIGTRMSEVYFPKVTLNAIWRKPTKFTLPDFNTSQISSSSLMAYLGVRGVGSIDSLDDNTNYGIVGRDFNATALLAYWDIFKNYYANKQEKDAYVIKAEEEIGYPTMKVAATIVGANTGNYTEVNGLIYNNWTVNIVNGTNQATTNFGMYPVTNGQIIYFKANTILSNADADLGFYVVKNGTGSWVPAATLHNDITYSVETDTSNGVLVMKIETTKQNWYINGILWIGDEEKSKIVLQKFPLENIDIMRQEIFKDTGLGNEFHIDAINDDVGIYPYRAVHETTSKHHCMSKYPLVGLALKTYQSDILNNWLSSEYIDGLNGIAAVTAIDTTDGNFTMDALNLAEKVYNMLNRIVVAGNTYEDWQEAVWGEKGRMNHESPIYLGGASATVAFEEVISTADTETDEAGKQPLGTLAGKGVITNQHGGHIEYHCDEAGYLIGIVSITPYIDYMQGNDFDMTEFDSINDVHKPALDGIGFQNLILERAAWWATAWDRDNDRWLKHSGGKLPAWIEYMTATNQVYGNFAENVENLGFMVLARRYEFGQTIQGNKVLPIEDWTTYINPTKYNYQFANNAIDAQNFWVQIGVDAIARRKMSAKIIPNL